MANHLLRSRTILVSALLFSVLSVVHIFLITNIFIINALLVPYGSTRSLSRTNPY